MKRNLAILLSVIFFFSTKDIFAQTELFSKRVVNQIPLGHPFAMVLGPDDSLWVTERRGYVKRVSIADGGTTTLLDIHNKVRVTASSASVSQDGLLSLALHPGLNKGTGNDYVYMAYCYDSAGIRRVKIVRYDYDRAGARLINELVLLKGLTGSDDHNSGRLAIGNTGTAGLPEYKLFYTIGDNGANQGSHICDSILSQYTPTAAQMSAGDLRFYQGKILRLNLDGSIPGDNPVFNGVRTHIYSIGHRNAQGLSFQKDADGELVPGGFLYSSEHGPAVGDEINIIKSGGNYGWPRVSGKYDNGWYKYYGWALPAHIARSGLPCTSYGGQCTNAQDVYGDEEFSFDTTGKNYQDPIFEMYSTIPTAACNSLTNPTVAPSSIIHYYFTNKIPGWSNNLLVPTLIEATLLRLRLIADGTGILPATDTLAYFRNINAGLDRYRDIALGKDGFTIYLLTDSVGKTSFPTMGNTNENVTNRGRILEFKYLGSGVLAIGNEPNSIPASRLNFRIYPNPASILLHVESKRNVSKPIRYQLYDIAGKKLLQGSSTQDKFDVPLSQLNKGTYVIKVFNGQDIAVCIEKIIIN